MRLSTIPPVPARVTTSPLRAGSGRTLLLALCWLLLVSEVGAWLWFLWRAAHSPFGEYDFSSYYAAALALRHNVHANIYSAAVIAHYGALGHVQVRPPLPYTYPPLFAMLIVPLTLLSFRVAARVWMVVNAGLWAGCTLLLAAEVRRILGKAIPTGLPAPAGSSDAAAAPWQWLGNPVYLASLAISAVVCLSFAPAQQTVLTGQVDLLVLLPLALVPWLTRRRHERWTGALLAGAAMMKFTPAILLVYLALRRRWQALATSLVTLAALVLVSAVVVGPAVFFDSITQALRTGTVDTTLGHNEALFASVLRQINVSAPTLEAPAHAASLLLLALLGLVIGLAIVRVRPRTTGPQEVDASDGGLLAYSMALCGLLLLAPTAWVHHYVWVMPTAVLLLALAIAGMMRAARGARGPWVWSLAVALLASLAIGWMLPHAWDTEPRPHNVLFEGLGLRPLFLELRALGTLLLLGVAMALARLTRAAPSARD
jgi:hypothetical protein